MINVRVTYTVKAGFVAQNKQNIELFMNDFRNLNRKDFRYNVYLLQDGKTFVHMSNYQNEEIQKQLLDTPSFKSFQKQRDDSGLEVQPGIEVLAQVASSHEL